MHASRQMPIGSTSIGSGKEAPLFSGVNKNDFSMKYVQLISQPEQASTSYAHPTPVINTTYPPQDMYSGAQVISSALAEDGSLVEYVIANRDYDSNGGEQTMYVELMQNVVNDDPETHLNEEELIAIERGYIDNPVPIKKSRYSRMSDEEKARYNARRRARRLELKQKKQLETPEPPDSVGHILAQVPVSQATTQLASLPVAMNPHNSYLPPTMNESILLNGQSTLLSQSPATSSEAKLESARSRYRNMTDEQRRIYNLKRTAAFRKKREEEESILNTALSKPSSTGLTEADEVMLRNARRAEKARLRYQRMSLEQRKVYNHRRTLAKKARKAMEPESSDASAVHSDSQRFVSPMAASKNVSVVNEEALSMLERDVLRRTHVAQMALQKQRLKNQSISSIDDTIEQVAAYGSSLPLEEPKEAMVEAVQDNYEPVNLPIMIVDQHGNPASLPEGSIIEVRQEHPNGPSTFVIHTPVPPAANQRYMPPQNQVIQLITTNMQLPLPMEPMFAPVEGGHHAVMSKEDAEEAARQEVLRQKRAARARERYHNMTDEERKQFNARRAVALRRARLRDEELCRLAEEARDTGKTLDERTQKAIREAQQRRAKRAESARIKYQRMTAEERRAYNANRDANRRTKKNPVGVPDKDNSDSEEIVVDDEPMLSFE